jgi:hypothetical protein
VTRLFFPEVIEILETDKLLLKDPDAQALKPRLERAIKYIFESEGDVDRETVQNIHLTSEEMIDAGLFHLPFPSIWIEDPWFDEWTKLLHAERIREGRFFWFCEEHDGRIDIFSVQANPPYVGFISQVTPTQRRKLRRTYTFHTVPHTIDLSPDRTRPEWAESFNSPLHSVRQFLVTLATAQADVEVVPGKPWKRKQPIKTREYEHRVLRILLPGETRHSVGESQSTGARRKLHFVSGYIWGKNTRPKEEQRWIAPFWRGDVKEGVSLTRHREVIRS